MRASTRKSRYHFKSSTIRQVPSVGLKFENLTFVDGFSGEEASRRHEAAGTNFMTLPQNASIHAIIAPSLSTHRDGKMLDLIPPLASTAMKLSEGFRLIVSANTPKSRLDLLPMWFIWLLNELSLTKRTPVNTD